MKQGYFHSSLQVHIIHTQDASSLPYEVVEHSKLRVDVNNRALHCGRSRSLDEPEVDCCCMQDMGRRFDVKEAECWIVHMPDGNQR